MSSQPVKQFGCQKIVTLGKYNDTYAKELISRSANQVFPIMLKRKWTVPFLTEFYPKDIRLLGLNRNRGQKVYIRLRPHFDEKTFLSYEDVLGTLLHELVHIVRGPHDKEFYKILDQLNDECDQFIFQPSPFSTSICPFSGKGFRLSGKISTPAEAAERRRLRGNQPSKIEGHRLGGETLTGKGMNLRQLIASAAIRRQKDNVWCGSFHKNIMIEISDEDEPEVKTDQRDKKGKQRESNSTSAVLIDLTLLDDPD
eukprot:Sdes_comp19567_c0_seq3m11244